MQRIVDDDWAMMPAVLLRLAYLGVTNALALLRLLPMSDRARMDVPGLVWDGSALSGPQPRAKANPAAICGTGSCPTVYRTNHGTIVIQGRAVAASGTDINLESGEALVEIPEELLIRLIQLINVDETTTTLSSAELRQ